MKKKVNYSFGSGSGDVFLAMRTKKFYFCYNAKDREELHLLYGGKQYYFSRSGASGAGFFLPEENDLLAIPGGYRAHITHLSEAWPAEMFGVKVMLPVEGTDLYSAPIIIALNKVLYFLSENQAIEAFSGNLPENHTHEVNYKYLTRNGEVDSFQIKWVGNGAYNNKNNRPCYIPYTFEEFVKVMGVIPTNIYPSKVLQDKVSFIESKLYLSKTEVGLARIGHFGLPVEKIEGDLFPQDAPRNFYSGWATQGFGSYQFAWKRVANGEKVYAIIQAIPSQLNEKYALLGNESIEYELVVENVLEWFSQPVGFWVEKMKNELLKKIRSEFLNSARWDQSQQVKKVRELLSSNPEILFKVEDSLAVGNCRPGTESWMDGFGIKEPISAKKLLKHKKFEEMIQNSRFRAVVINKLFVDSEK